MKGRSQSHHTLIKWRMKGHRPAPDWDQGAHRGCTPKKYHCSICIPLSTSVFFCTWSWGSDQSRFITGQHGLVMICMLILLIMYNFNAKDWLFYGSGNEGYICDDIFSIHYQMWITRESGLASWCPDNMGISLPCQQCFCPAWPQQITFYLLIKRVKVLSLTCLYRCGLERIHLL